MPGTRHPFDTDTIYALDDDGNIRVTKGQRFGIFTSQGVHVSGEIRHADPQLCVWVGNNPAVDAQQVQEACTSIAAKRS